MSRGRKEVAVEKVEKVVIARTHAPHPPSLAHSLTHSLIAALLALLFVANETLRGNFFGPGRAARSSAVIPASICSDFYVDPPPPASQTPHSTDAGDGQKEERICGTDSEWV